MGTVAAMGKVVLVTGAASGIGRATARLLCERGYRVVAADLRREAVEEAVSDLGAAVTAVACDVRSPGDTTAAIQVAEGQFGGLDAVAHVAGVEIDRPVDLLPEDAWDTVVDTNLKGTYLVCAAAVPALRRRGSGAIVTTGSVLGRVALPGVTAYGASKAGVEALTRTMALDYARDGIRVNCIVPGATDTPLMWVGLPPEAVAETRRRAEGEIPLGRIAAPIEIAHAIAFLLSDEASFITGASLAVDGGHLARSAVSA